MREPAGNGMNRRGVLRSVMAPAFAVPVLASLAAGLSGCTALLPKTPADTYEITAPDSFPGLRGGSNAQLLVLEPSALKVLDSQNIVIKPGDQLVQYLEKSQWTDRLPKVVQAKLVETFENTGRVRAVAKPGEGLVIDYQLVSDIRDFQADLTSGEQVARVSISVKLVSDRTGKVVRTRVFEETVPLVSTTPPEVVAAIDAAFDKMARDLVAWTFAGI